MQDNGSIKKVNEPYLVDALTFTEAEARIIEEMKPFISGEFSISAVKKTKIAEIFFNEGSDKYYMVKYFIQTIDESKGVEKKVAVNSLVQAPDFDSSLSLFREAMNGTLADYEIASITETQIMDVYPLDLGNN